MTKAQRARGLAGLLVCLSTASWTHAARIYVDAGVASSGTGASWAEAKKTIGEGLAAAADGDEVRVAQGTYPEAIEFPSGVALYGGFDKSETSPSDRDLQAHPSVIDGSTARAGSPAYHVAKFAYGTGGARLDGFTVTGGNANGTTIWDDQYGGGVYIGGGGGSIVITHCIVEKNRADLGGGGVWTDDASPTITDCTIRQNTARFGGGVQCIINSSPLISGCTLTGNTGDYGGGMDLSHSSPTIVGCVISANSSGYGGGMECDYYSAPLVENCVISGNAASIGGGGVMCNQGSSPRISNCDISGNSAGQKGGGIHCYGSSSPSLVNCTVSGNTTGWSGGGATYCEYSSSPALTNVIFDDNPQLAVCETDYGSAVQFTSCLFHGNPDGDFYSSDTSVLAGAAAINALVPGASQNVDGDPRFLDGAQGIWTTAPAYDADRNITTLADALASFAPGALAGRMINPNGAQRFQFLIEDNSTTATEVVGDASGIAQPGDSYRIIDHHLRLGSAAIDAGTAAGAPAVDMDGQKRPFDVAGTGQNGTGAEFDIGRDEYYPDPQMRGVQDANFGQARLSWADSSTSQLMFLGIAWDLYRRDWVANPDDLAWGPWYPFPPEARSGVMNLGFSGAYDLWISALGSDSSWEPCADPWVGIVYSGTPHSLLDASAEDLGGLHVRLHWRPEIYGTWLYAVIAYRQDDGWVSTLSGDWDQLWHFIDYGQLGYQAGTADFFAGTADFTVPSAGDYWFFLIPFGWLAPPATGAPAVVPVTVQP